MLSVHQRPFPPDDRTEAGHWEADLIVGSQQGSVIGTLIERQTRLIRLLHLPSRDADALRRAISHRMADLPASLIRSITWDQGIEMARHVSVTAEMGAQVYFCDPHSPWQRGSNENANGLLDQSTAAAVLPERHQPVRLEPGTPAGSRKRNQLPLSPHHRQPQPRRAVRRLASLNGPSTVATLTRTRPRNTRISLRPESTLITILRLPCLITRERTLHGGSYGHESRDTVDTGSRQWRRARAFSVAFR
jgi:hypothetical protein